MRKKAAETFHLDQEEMDERHHLTFEPYELGKLTDQKTRGKIGELLESLVAWTKRLKGA